MKKIVEKNIIDVRNLSIGYHAVSIADDINFSLNAGQFCAIVGINGIGKSTLLRTIGKLQSKLAGDLFLEGKKLESLSSKNQAQMLSVVLTEPIASKNLTVAELIALGRQPYTNWLGSLTKRDKDAVKKNLQIFELEALQLKKCHELSDGQLQRVLIARAVTQETPIILLDEPTTHLDLSHKVQIFKLLQQLAHDNGKTIVFTTHEIDLAIQLCDKILILDGKENPFGTPRELIEGRHFERLFPKEMVQFDTKTGSFKVNK